MKRQQVSKSVKTETVSVRTIGLVSDQIHQLAQLHQERDELYGVDYLRIGPSLLGMFPDGIELRTSSDFTRFALFLQAHGKLVRYAARFGKGGHVDSLNDISVYAQLLRHADEVS